MRKFVFVAAASAAAILAATAANARPTFGASRVEGARGESASTTSDGASIIEAVAALIGFKTTAKTTPIAGSEPPRSAAARAEPCDDEKKRAESAKAVEARRTAEAEKRPRRGDPVYLAF